MRKAEAICHGAVTIVNAMATGKGAAVGVGLRTWAKVSLTNKPGKFVCRNLVEPNDDILMRVIVNRVFRECKLLKKYGAIVETRSNIPVAVGLKSSSAASNAIALAALKAANAKIDNYGAVQLGVDSSLEARVTITGAFDDASACFFGGIMITNNLTRQVLKRFIPLAELSAIIYVPRAKKYTKDVDVSRLTKIRPMIELAIHEALRGNYWFALTLNGLAYSDAFGYDSDPIRRAIFSGALASGLTGKGPAFVAVAAKENIGKVQKAWNSLPGRVIMAPFNLEKAKATLVNR